jgi:hypothetical protein
VISLSSLRWLAIDSPGVQGKRQARCLQAGVFLTMADAPACGLTCGTAAASC